MLQGKAANGIHERKIYRICIKEKEKMRNEMGDKIAMWIKSAAAAIGGAAAWGATEEQFLAVAMSLHLFTVLMTVVLYAAARIIASILGYVLKIIFVHGEPNIASRIGGLVIGAAKGAVTVMLALFIVSAIFPFSFSAPVNEQLAKSKTASAICNVEYRFITERLYGNQTLELMMENKFTKSEPDPGTVPDAPETT